MLSSAKSRDGYFQCGFCKKHYNRADHLIRHVRSHTREKPYVCHICNKGFARPDLMKRHAAGHDQPRDGKRKRPPPYPKNGRVSQACKACSTSKLKCDENKPCRRCREKDLVCDWQEAGHDAPDAPDARESDIQVDPESEAEAEAEADTDPDQVQEPHDLPLDSPSIDRSTAFPPDSFATPGVSMDYLPLQPSTTAPNDLLAAPFDQTLSPIMDHDSGVFSIDGQFFPEFIPPSLARPADLDPSSFPQDYIHGMLESNMHFDFNLTDVDFGLIDFFNTRGMLYPDANDRSDVDSGIALGAEAYQRSSLSAWKPSHKDRAFADQGDLSVPKSIDSPEASVRSERQVLGERLSHGTRDLIFGMVLQTSQKANLTGIMRSFPSTELLDSLIQDFFDHQTHQIDSWIHGPTFRPNDENPDLLAILAAAGAARSPIPTIRKLGFALMEVVRLQMSNRYENDNRTIRDLRASQTFALVLDIGIWSGNGRRTEIAESFEQPLVTMLRRGLRFRRSPYSIIVPSIDDSQETLESKWREWVEQESFKRLVHHLFLHDAQSALMLNINPLFSYAEMEIPFPSNRTLWEAKSAVEWRDLYLLSGTMGPARLPSLVDALHDMSELSQRVDLQLSAYVLLHGLSALINEYHRLKFISKGSSKHWNGLVINSRHQELSQVIQHFRMLSHEWTETPRPEIYLIHEMISMLLYMSLEELQLFAGKEDKKEARRVYHSALEWIESIDSRRAVWHAGQVIRAAKAMPPGSLTGILAVGVYYASLAFWSYSVVFKAKNPKVATTVGSPQSGPHPRSTVFLDGEETTDVQKFVSLGCGCPALQGSSGPAFIANPSQTMDVAQEVLCAAASHDALPPLVQGLRQLMGDLGRAAAT